MPSRTQDKIYETFVAISGSHSPSRHSMIDASERIAKPGARTGAQIRTAKPVTWRADELATPNRPVGTTSSKGGAATTSGSNSHSVASTVLQSVFQSVPLAGAVAGAASGTSGSAGGGSIGHTIETVASTVLKSGLGMIPLIGGLLGLFGGGGSPAPPVLTKYVMPSPIAFEGVDNASGMGGAEYDQMGMPRAYSVGVSGAPQTGLTGTSGNSGSGSAGLTSASGSGGAVSAGETLDSGNSGRNAPTPQNTVDGEAMDARWFLDHSADIAAAVRYAMLNSNSINDVVNEL
jgi:hypothetical protein